jgi:MFS family permease
MHPHLPKLFHLNIYAFILSIHIAFIVYTGSTFLSGIFGTEYIWIIYSLGAFFSLLLNFSITPILRNVKIEKINTFSLLIAGSNLMLLSSTTAPFTIFLSYVLYTTLSEYLLMISSIMIEDLSKDVVTGSIRGRFITMQSLAYVVAPFFTSFTINYFGLSSIFLISGIFIFASLIYFKTYVKSVPEIKIPEINFYSSLKRIWKNYDIRVSILTLIAMNIFYVAAVVFIPFKMESLGIPLTTYLSILMPIALTPFLFMPNILGHIEDVMKDEKQFIQFGTLGLIFSLALFSLVSSNSIIVWACILFISRIFASMTETSVNSYFFKKIGASDTATISLFQSSASLAYLIFSPILSLVLIFGNLQSVFLTVSFFLCFMLILVSKIHNTDNYEKHKAWSEIWRRTKRRVG